MHEKQGSAADEGAAEQFITDLEAGMFEQMLSVALRKVAAAVVSTGKKGEVSATFTFEHIENTQQVEVKSALEFKRPTTRGSASDKDTGKTVFFVAKGGALESEMALQLRAAKLDAGMVRQWCPFADVGFRFDFAWPNYLYADGAPHNQIRKVAVALEIEGGIWRIGAHSSGTGITRDIVKGNRAALAGITLLRATAEHVKSGRALEWVAEALR